MANHGAATLLLIACLLVAATLSSADARLTVRPDNKVAAALRSTRLTVRHDTHGQGYVVDVAPVPQLTCSKVHGVQVGETCSSVGEGAGLSQEEFLGFNPNINCEKVFVGQWVCLQATSA